MDIPPIFRWLVGLPLLAICQVHAADYRDEVGYTKLQAEISSALPTGTGISVSQVEASLSNTSIICYPDTALAEFAGKTFNNLTGSTNVSSHATEVAQNYYSSTNSMVPGVATIDVYRADTWISGNTFLRSGSVLAPKTENRDIENHSWIGGTGDSASDQEILHRLDFAIQRDDFVAAVGLNNGFGNPVPSLLGSFYNGIAVGLSNGNHSAGLTTEDGSGRIKPDIVSSSYATSFATPQVGAAAAILYSKLHTTYTIANYSMVVKALLLAGATKTEFPNWTRSNTQPLDTHYGAGQLNIYRSYFDLLAGQQVSSNSVSKKPRGWDYNATDSSTSRFYFFDIAANNTASGFSAILTWNRVIAPNPSWPNTTSTLANLSLKLYNAIGFTVGAVYDSSVSAVDNVEHIYQPNLPAGRYALEVSSSSSVSTNYGLAWTSVPNIQITATTPNASENGLVPGVFTVTRSGDTSNATNVFYTVAGSATNGTDYQSIASFLTFAVGETSKTITIAPLADNLSEGDETISLSLVSDIAYGLDNTTSATVTLHDLPFDAWRFGKFVTSELADPNISSASADPDADGISNLLEYALSLEPKTVSTTGLPTPALENGTPTLTYTRVKAATDITYLPEISDDLLTWHSGSGYLTESQVSDNGATETIKAISTSSGHPSGFLRLRVTRN